MSAILLTLTILLCACGTKSGRFRIEGRFKNLNQGEFYIYCPYAPAVELDTIKVSDGRFSYEVPLDDKATFVIIFPNLSEQVVFGESGATVKIDGDASHLREMKITGTDTNKQMTDFRLNVNKMTPPEATKSAIAFATEHPASPVSLYLVDKYLITSPEPDYARAYTIVKAMQKADPDNGQLVRLGKQLEALRSCAMGSRLSDFKANDIDGKPVTRKATLNGKVNVVSTWAVWSYDSQNMLRRLNKLKKQYGSDLALLNICVDGSPADYRKRTERDSIPWPTVCDGNMWDTPLLKTFGLSTVPGNVVIDSKGIVIARNLNDQQLEDKIKSVLK